MTSSQNVSLYELALASDQSPTPLKISPTTFKSMVDCIVDTLVKHDVPATIWVKLPRGKVWKATLSHYCKMASVTPSIYILRNSQTPTTPHASSTDVTQSTLNKADSFEGQPKNHPSIISDQDDDDDDDEPLATESLNSNNLLGTVLPLTADSRLKREYFILALAPNFQALALAHRPRSARQASNDASLKRKQTTSYGLSRTIIEDDRERRQSLLGICAFDERTIHNVLNGIKSSIALGDSLADTLAEREAVLSKWPHFVQQVDDAPVNSLVFGNFWSSYVQRFEDVWAANSNARKQADIASGLQFENEELINALRLKDEFLKTVGQELRTPLSTMKTALSLLGSSSLKPNQRQRYMDLLSQECDRQSALITSVLEFVQLENVDEQTSMQPLRIVDVVPGVVSTYQPLAQEKGVMLAYTIPEDLPTISCVGTWLRQIVINLLHNGIKFTPEGGQVWVRSRQQGDYVQLEFKDTGIGIASSEIPKIFNRFYRVRQTATEDSSGAGLGLSIVQQLLLKCGGSISVKSRLGEGSVFNVMLPVYQQDQ